MTRHSLTARFLVQFIAFLLAILLSAAVFNYIVNPYDIFPPSSIQLNLVKTETDPKLKAVKQVQIFRQKPDCLLVGSSRGQYLDPGHESLEGYRCLNIAGGYMRSMSRLYETLVYASRVTELSLVILGLDMRMFTYGGFDKDVVHRNRPQALTKIPQYLFSKTTLVDSFTTVFRQFDAEVLPTYLPGGQRNPEYEYRKIEKYGGHIASFKSTVSQVNTRVLDRVTLDDEVLGYLSKLFRLAHRKEFGLRIYFSPSHAWWWNVISEKGYWDLFEQWKREIVRINGQEAVFAERQPFAVHDFTGYYPYTTVNPTKARMEYHFEASHFTPKLSGKVLDVIMNSEAEQPRFGIVLDSENIEQHLQVLRAQKENQGISAE